MRTPTLLLLALACRTPGEVPDIDLDPPTPDVPPPTSPNVPDPNETYAGLADLACATGSACAPTDATWLDDTCCAFGDNLTMEQFAYHLEAVDVASNDTWVVSCSGFGGAFGRHDGDATDFALTNFGNPRCQRIEFGPMTPEGQVVYLAHHGDGWVADPWLWTYVIDSEGNASQRGELGEGLLYEDMAATDDWLYVATHATGIAIYSLDDEGIPSFHSTLGGFGNAIDLHVDGDRAWVIDADRLVVLDLTDPAAPSLVDTVTLAGNGRDLDRRDDTLYVAVGTEGVEIFDITNRDLPVSEGLLPVDGTVQSVHAADAFVAVSNWNHVSLLDPDTRKVIATERTVPTFEQDLGITVVDDTVVVAEWSGLYSLQYQPGWVAPDIWVEEEIVTFAGDTASTYEMLVRNRGPLNLVVDEVFVSDRFAVNTTGFTLEPGAARVVQIDYVPPEPEPNPSIAFFTNDPDVFDNPLDIRLHATSTGLLDVGDTLTEDFAFLDPTGQNDLANLEGHVIVLAYFALF